MHYWIVFILILLAVHSNNDQIVTKNSPKDKQDDRHRSVRFSPTITLSSGRSKPLIGLGTFPLPNTRSSFEALTNAIQMGYRAIDTAFKYDNEKVVGLAVNTMIELGYVDRKDLFVVTKIANTYHSRELVAKQTKLSLQNLGLDYVDLLLMHYPTGFAYSESNPKLWFPKYPNGTTIPRNWQKDDWIDTWRGMEDMVRQGLAKSIGISNFNAQQMDKLLMIAEIRPVLNQFECNVFYQQIRLVEHCHKLGVHPEAYSPLHPDAPKDPTIAEIARRKNVTAFQVALRWLVQRGLGFDAKTVHKEYMDQNLDVFSFSLTDQEMTDILKLKPKPKKIDDKGSHSHPDYPFNEPMDPNEPIPNSPTKA